LARGKKKNREKRKEGRDALSAIRMTLAGSFTLAEGSEGKEH